MHVCYKIQGKTYMSKSISDVLWNMVFYRYYPMNFHLLSKMYIFLENCMLQSIFSIFPSNPWVKCLIYENNQLCKLSGKSGFIIKTICPSDQPSNGGHLHFKPNKNTSLGPHGDSPRASEFRSRRLVGVWTVDGGWKRGAGVWMHCAAQAASLSPLELSPAPPSPALCLPDAPSGAQHSGALPFRWVLS